MENCKIIAIANQKGGVAKTTTAINMAYGLKEHGKKVLIADLDPQNSLTTCMGIRNPENLEYAVNRLFNAFIQDDDFPPKEKYILHCKNGIDLIPSNIELSTAEINLISAMSREYILKNILADLKSDYDYIIIDNNPQLGLLMINALAAADMVIIPTKLEYPDLMGLTSLIKSIKHVKKLINRDLQFGGILVTMYTERTKLSRQVLEQLTTVYGNQINIFESKIPMTVKISEANLSRKSVIEYCPGCKAAKAYKEFVKEFEAL